MSNPYGKRRDVNDPYARYVWPNFGEWRVLKLNQTPKQAAKNPYATAFCAVKTDMTYGSWEYGDVYVRDIPTLFHSGTDILAELRSMS